MVAVGSAGVKVLRNRVEALGVASSKAMSDSTVGYRESSISGSISGCGLANRKVTLAHLFLGDVQQELMSWIQET